MECEKCGFYIPLRQGLGRCRLTSLGADPEDECGLRDETRHDILAAIVLSETMEVPVPDHVFDAAVLRQAQLINDHTLAEQIRFVISRLGDEGAAVLRRAMKQHQTSMSVRDQALQALDDAIGDDEDGNPGLVKAREILRRT
jgi:hypothetical protein